MRHPLLYPLRNLYFYFIAWACIILAHAIVLTYFFHFNLSVSVTDACISNSIFALMALSFWYTVRFISIDTGRALFVILNHLIALILFLTLWHYSSFFLLNHLEHDTTYLSFLSGSVPLRLLIGTFLYSIIILAYYLYKYHYTFKQKIIREAEWDILVKESELALLKSQLQPHFIFNCLNSIHALLISDPERAQQMLLNLSSFLRLSMIKDQTKLVPLHEELENSALYSDIEKIRFGDRLIIHTVIEERTLSILVPHQILQPIIENAIKHGLYNYTGVVTILIEACMKEEQLHLSISNNYDPEEKKQDGNGIGLKHVRRRLLLLYGRKNLVHITDENGIFKIELIIPD